MNTLAQIAASLPGYQPQNLSVSAASAFLAALATPVDGVETVGILDALDRVLAQDIVSPISVPPHDNSAMDGYAYASASSTLPSSAPVVLQVVGSVLAGQAWQGALQAGQCLKIMTGAALPAGLDTVVPFEAVTLQGEHISFAPLRPGANRRRAGEDLLQGQAALRQGDRLTPAALGLLASLGLATVPVLRRLRVAYFSTGDEILSLGEAPRAGAVFDSNRYTVTGLLRQLGVEVLDLGVVRDDPALLQAALHSAAQQADAILTSGGMSAGDADHTRSMLGALGEVVFWQLAIKPGRPMAVGRMATNLQAKTGSGADFTSATSYTNHSKPPAVLFGLPGNPVAVMVVFLALVRPALLQMMGCNAASSAAAPLLQVRSAQAIRKRPGRTEYLRGIVEPAADGSLWVRLTGHQGSGMLSSMVQANGLLVLAEAQGDVAEGDTVNVMPLNA
nr:gephyrin-like molybdotransferase Glp [uncultured Albidiferax sp.]